MAKPTYDTKWAASATKIEPSSGQKDAGHVVGGFLFAQWENSWKDGVDKWVKWLQAFEDTAHTWTALQTFTPGLGVGIVANGQGNNEAIQANAGPTVGAYAIKGNGQNIGGNFGTNGILGTGGTGHLLGGAGIAGVGGAASAANGQGGAGAGFLGGQGGSGAGVGGLGVSITGGAIDGTVNTTGAGGIGGQITGGAITSDANHRLGGVALQLTGGLGQDGYGNALQLIHGDLIVDDGSIVQGGGVQNVLINTQVDGDLSVVGNITGVLGTTTLTGLLTANGGITLAARTTVFGGVGFQNSWADATGLGSERVSFRKDPLGIVRMEGAASGGSTGTIAFTMPAGARPAKQQNFACGDYGTSNTSGYTVAIATNGNVTLTFISGNHAPNFDGITFATT